MIGHRRILLRWIFLLAVVAGAWWSWRTSGDELARAIQGTSPTRIALGAALVLAGVILTGPIWVLSLRSFTPTPHPRDSIASFFVAQLGKYIPGSIWSFAAQGALGAAQGLPARVPAAAAILFLGVHVASGLVAVGLLGWWTGLPRPVVGIALAVGLAGLAPAVYRTIGGRIAAFRCDWQFGRSVQGTLLMMPVWCCYALSLTAMAPSADASSALWLGCSFALAFAVGVAVPIAPAGLGARDGVLIVLISPLLGVGPAGAVAVLSRLVHTVADFVLAGVSWWLMRASAAPQASSSAGDHH